MLVRQPNGKYAEVDTYGFKATFNITAEEFIEQYVDNARKEAKDMVKFAQEDSIARFSSVYSNWIKKYGYEKTKEMMEAIGFNMDQVIHNFTVTISSTGFSNHDCCDYGICPICGETVNSWRSTCKNCGQRYKIV